MHSTKTQDVVTKIVAYAKKNRLNLFIIYKGNCEKLV